MVALPAVSQMNFQLKYSLYSNFSPGVKAVFFNPCCEKAGEDTMVRSISENIIFFISRCVLSFIESF